MDEALWAAAYQGRHEQHHGRETGAELSISIRSGSCWTRYPTGILFFIAIAIATERGATRSEFAFTNWIIEAASDDRDSQHRDSVCLARSRPLVETLQAWIGAQLSRKSPMGTALAYIVNHWEAQPPKIECTARLYSRPRFLGWFRLLEWMEMDGQMVIGSP